MSRASSSSPTILPVAFAGAGPGEAGWLCLETLELMACADICYYDALVSPAILALIPPQVELHHVGKRGDSESFDQLELNLLLISSAKAGLKVLRLKGGDSAIFGRLTEETDALAAAGIPWTLTPGVTALQSLASCTGIHLTQRGVSDRLTLMTARLRGGGRSGLQAPVESSQVIYMGILSLPQIQADLLQQGYPPELPVAVALHLTRPQQELHFLRLDGLADFATARRPRPPGLIILGAAAAADLQRLSPSSPLLNCRFLIWPASQTLAATALARQLRRHGARPLILPRLELLPDLAAGASALLSFEALPVFEDLPQLHILPDADPLPALLQLLR